MYVCPIAICPRPALGPVEADAATADCCLTPSLSKVILCQQSSSTVIATSM